MPITIQQTVNGKHISHIGHWLLVVNMPLSYNPVLKFTKSMDIKAKNTITMILLIISITSNVILYFLSFFICL